METSEDKYFAISIVNFNKLDYLKKCVESVLEFTKFTPYKIFISDNGSTDGSREWLIRYSKTKDVIIPILYEKNIGFIEANNIIADKIINGEPPFDNIKYLVLVNNDFTFLENWDEKVKHKFDQNPNLAILGIDSPIGELDKSGNGKAILKRRDYIEGFFLVTRKDIIKKLGLFNKNMRIAYCEDSDFSLRVRERGYDIDVIRLKYNHPRAITSRILRKDKRLDLDGAQRRNTTILRDEWEPYLESNGSFDNNLVFKRSAATGDVLLMTPVFKLIKEEFPHSTIWVHTFPIRMSIISHCRYIDHVITRETFDFSKLKPFEFIDLDLAYEKDSSIHIVDAYLKVVANSVPKLKCLLNNDVDYRPTIELLNNEVLDAKNKLKQLERPIITLDISDSWSSRMLPIKTLYGLSVTLMDAGFSVVKIGRCFNQTNRLSVPCHLDLSQRLTMREVASVISLSDLHVGPDNLWMHVAYSFQRPLVAWFGCIDPKYRIDVNDPLVRVIYKKELQCIGCHHWRKSPRVSTDCIRNRIECMESIKVSDIMDEIKNLFSGMRYEDKEIVDEKLV